MTLIRLLRRHLVSPSSSVVAKQAPLEPSNPKGGRLFFSQIFNRVYKQYLVR